MRRTAGYITAEARAKYRKKIRERYRSENEYQPRLARIGIVEIEKRKKQRQESENLGVSSDCFAKKVKLPQPTNKKRKFYNVELVEFASFQIAFGRTIVDISNAFELAIKNLSRLSDYFMPQIKIAIRLTIHSSLFLSKEAQQKLAELCEIYQKNENEIILAVLRFAMRVK